MASNILRIALQRRGAALPNLAGVVLTTVGPTREMPAPQPALPSRTPVARRVACPFDA